MKKNMSLNSGITIITLVVTIMVLIILATVSIRMVIGEGGLIGQANNSSSAYRAAAVEEEVSAWQGEQQMIEFSDGMALPAQTKEELIASQLERGMLTEEEAKQARETGQVTIGKKTIYYTQKIGEAEETINYDHVMDPASAPTIVAYDPITDGPAQAKSMKKYTLAENDTVNSVITSFDSKLCNIINACVDGRNYKRLDSNEWTTNFHGLFTVEFATNAKEFIFVATGSLRVSVDENDGRGYIHTNERGYIDKDADDYNVSNVGYDIPRFKFYKVTFANAKDRNIKLELKGAIASLYVNDENGQYEIRKIDKTSSKTIMFVGDSWTTGHSLVDGDGREIQYLSYPTVIGDNLGMTTMNCAVGGSGYTEQYGNVTLTTYEERFREAFDNVKLDPDIIVVCGGGNDISDVKNNGKKMEDVISSAKSCLNYIRSAKPNTKVIVFGAEFANSERYYASKDLLGELDTALKQSAKDNNMCFVDFINGDAYNEKGQLVYDGNEIFVTDASDVLSDGIHLTLEGYKKMGDKLTPIVAQLIK